MKGILLLFLCCSFTSVCHAVFNVMVGLKYRNYTNYHGTLADGTCCDYPSLTAPNCPPDQCDTSFMPCATYVGGQKCKAYYENPTPLMVDNNSFILDSKIGNVNTSAALMVFVGEFSQGDIYFSMEAREGSATDQSKKLISKFSFIIDWMETSFSDPPHWRQLILTDTTAELGLDVFHQCNVRYFGPTCSTFCDPTDRYTCLDDGSKNCTKGWDGPECDALVPYCNLGLCMNGGNCTNIHLGFRCSCWPPFTGLACETDLSLPAADKTTAGTTPLPTTTPSLLTSTEATTSKAPTTLSTQTTVVPTVSRVPTTSASPQNTAKPKTTGFTTGSSTHGQMSTTPFGPSVETTSTKTTFTKTSSTSGEDATVIVATSVPGALCLLGLLSTASVYLYKKLKRSPAREKVSPSPEPSTRKASLDVEEPPLSPSEAWNSTAPANHKEDIPTTLPASVTSF